MRLTIMILVTLLCAAAFALGIFFFSKPDQIREALEPIPTSSYRPTHPSSAPKDAVESGIAPEDVNLEADDQQAIPEKMPEPEVSGVKDDLSNAIR